jgi:hypothetical protein
MKKLLVIAAAILSFGAAKAQVAYLGYQGISGNTKAGSTTICEAYNGVFAGGAYNFDLYENVGVQPGLEVNFYTRTENNVKDYSMGLRIPVDFNYCFDVATDLKVYCFAGPSFYIGLLQEQEIGDVSTDRYEDQLTRFAFGVSLGAWCDWKDMLRLKVGFDFELNDRSVTSVNKYKENIFSVSVGYVF